MRTDGAIITNAGQELLSYALANNKQVNFTKVKLGKGDVNTFDEAKKLTDVVSFYKQIPITSIARNNAGIVRIRSSFTNADFPLQVVLKEIGIFAVAEGKSEVLFGYVNDGEGESFPPGSSGNIVERIRDIYVGVSTNTQVTAVIDRSVVYATIYDLDEEIAKCAKKITRVNPGNGIHGGGTLGEDITVSVKSNDTSINLDVANGVTLKKTTSWLNDAAQLFTAKGALNLFNTLTTSFTDAINTAKEAIRLDIIKKLDKTGDIMTGPLDAPILTAETYFRLKDYYTHTLTAEFWLNKDNPNYSPETLYIDGIKDILVGRNRVYHQGFKPTAQDIGALPKEYCPYRVGDVLKTTSDIHPAISWVGTSWEKIENRFLMGTSGSEGAGGIGGASEIRLSVAQMPSHGHNLNITLQANGRHRHKVDDHIHGQPPHVHGMPLCFAYTGGSPNRPAGNAPNGGTYPTESAGGENTGVASPYTSFEPDHTHSVSASITETGVGQSISIVPPYYKVHIWERLS